MDDGQMVVTMIGILCGTGVSIAFINMIKAAILRRGSSEQSSLVNEIRALREEVQHVRQQNNDVILNLDSQMRVLDRRLDHLEDRALTPGSQASSEHQTVGTRRS